MTVYRGVQTFPPEGVDAARASRHSVGDRWFVDETYMQVAGRWAYLYRAVDQQRQVINVLSSKRRNARAAPALFTRVVSVGPVPVEVTTDRGPVYSRVLDELVPAARHVLEQYATNVVAADHGRLKARPRPMRGLTRLRSARIIAAGHAVLQNLRRGHHDVLADQPPLAHVRTAFDQLALCI